MLVGVTQLRDCTFYCFNVREWIAALSGVAVDMPEFDFTQLSTILMAMPELDLELLKTKESSQRR